LQVENALLAYNEGLTPDFLLVELRDGRLRIGLDDGSGNTTWKGAERLDTNSWHQVELRQQGHKRFIVIVDERQVTELQVDLQRNVFDMFEPLYIGGLPAHLLTSRRPHGLTTAQPVSAFVGCLATLTVNGDLFDPTGSLPASAVPGCRS